jgi:hypothetical protein
MAVPVFGNAQRVLCEWAHPAFVKWDDLIDCQVSRCIRDNRGTTEDEAACEFADWALGLSDNIRDRERCLWRR